LSKIVSHSAHITRSLLPLFNKIKTYVLPSVVCKHKPATGPVCIILNLQIPYLTCLVEIYKYVFCVSFIFAVIYLVLCTEEIDKLYFKLMYVH